MNNDLEKISREVGNLLESKGFKLVIAESCTGGLVAASITAIPGSSSYFETGFVTYSNRAKIDMLNVPADSLNKYGAVSEQVVCAMAEGALKNGKGDVSIAVTGIAGPTGETPDKPIGTVFFAWKILDSNVIWKRKNFNGTRDSIRLQSATYVLKELITILQEI